MGKKIVLFYRSGSEYNVSPDIPIYALAGEKAEYKSMRPLKKYLGLRGILKKIDMSVEERTAMADAARNKILTYCSLKNSTDALCRCFEE